MTQNTMEKTVAELAEELRIANVVLKAKCEEQAEVLRKERFDSASRLAAMELLNAELEAAKEETKRQIKESYNLKRKLAGLEDAAQD